jgi:hypothetical protein
MGALTRILSAASARIAAVCLLGGLGAVAGLLFLSHSGSAPTEARTAPVEVAASFDPALVEFGDRISARVVVALDTRLVRTQTLRLTDDLAPLTQLGPADTSRSTRGGLELVTLTVPVACLGAACVAAGGETQLRLPTVRVSVVARSGRIAHASTPWPAVSVRGRVTSSDLKASSPIFEVNTTPPAATYRIAPATLATLLDVFAMLCGLSAVGLAGTHVYMRLRRRRRPQFGALERALRLTREAERRPGSDRRRALSLLGRALGDDRRSNAARRLAWSEPTPGPDQLEELVSEIEQPRPE